MSKWPETKNVHNAIVHYSISWSYIYRAMLDQRLLDRESDEYKALEERIEELQEEKLETYSFFKANFHKEMTENICNNPQCQRERNKRDMEKLRRDEVENAS